jgi:threonine/homoserine/homoserine lactone efflux protein
VSWPTLLAFWGAFTLALVSPGPNFALLLRIGLASGRAPALRTALGIALGEAVWGFAALLGVAALALRYPALGSAIRWAGGAFLLWLAVAALRSAWRGNLEAPAHASEAGGFWTGFLLMLLNAKAGFFWVSLTGVLLGPLVATGVTILVIAVAVALSLLWHGLLALAFSGRRLHALYRRGRRTIESVLGIVLAGLGLRVLATG